MSKGRIIHITLEKSGSQWVKDILTAPELSSYSKYSYSGISRSFYTDNNLELPESVISGPIYGMNELEWKHWKSNNDKAIVVLRDPRDVLVSLYYSWLYSHASTPGVDYIRELLLKQESDMERWMILIPYFRSDLKMYSTWMSSDDDASYLIKFENLLKVPVSVFKKLLQWLDWDVPTNVLEQVIERLSFESMSGRKAGVEDKFSHHRKGVSGDWKSHFTSQIGKYWETLYPNFLVEMGYENNSNWWESLPVESAEKSTVTSTYDEQGISQMLAITKKRNKFLEEELMKKEVTIQELAKACEERLQLINQLNGKK